MPWFARALRRAAETWRKIAPALRRAWDRDFRKRRISWTRFREKRLTWRGFLSFDTNARIRTYVYLAILALQLRSFYGPDSIVSLVRIAIQAIEMAGLPATAYSVMMYQDAMEVHDLQQRLIVRYDTNRNRRIDAGEARILTRETGLAPCDLAISVRRGDLRRLLIASHRKHILPPRITSEVSGAYQMSANALLGALRRSNYQKGLNEYERQRAQMWKEVEPDLTYHYARPKDYVKWETWRRGLERLYQIGRGLVALGLYYADPRTYCRSAG
jgi:hypothetical protein